METGRRLYDQKNYARAILEWKNAVDLAKGDEVLKKGDAVSPSSGDARVGLGSFYVLMRRDAGAEKAFRGAVEIDPKNG